MSEHETINENFNMTRYVKEFEETYFWRRVMLPTMQASILNAMERMVYLDDIREFRNLQSMVKTTQKWISFPKHKHHEAVEDADFEAQKYSDKAMDEVLSP